jgi:hypothetical protein
MFKKCISAVALLVLFGTLSLAAEDISPASAPPKAGYALLDFFISTFLELTKSGSSVTLEQNLPKMMAEAKKAREEKQIDLVFYARYTRMLAIFKLVTTPDPERIIGPIVDKEVSSFIKDTIGEEGENKNSIRQLSEALKEEILDLQLYLDNQAAKEKLRKEFDKKFQDAFPQKK